MARPTATRPSLPAVATDVALPLPAPPPRDPRARQAFAAFAAYLLVSFVLFAVPVLPHFATRFAGAGQGDARMYAWFLAWWPHALAVGSNPFLPHVAWFPGGFDVAWTTGLPGPSLAMAPITAWLGPIGASNVLTVLAAPLAGFGAFLLARRLTTRFWPAFVGGYLFAFGTYEIAQLRGHVDLFLIFPVPLAAYLFVRVVDGSLGDRTFTLLFALALVVELSISIEVFATATTFGGAALAGVWLLGPRDLRGRLLRGLAGAGIAYVLALVVLTPYLYYLLLGNAVLGHPLPKASVDLLSFVVPRPSILLGGSAFARVTSRLPSNTSEDGAYLGAPLIALIVLCVARARRDRPMRLPLSFAAVAALAALGPELHVDGHPVAPLPWALATNLPLLRFALPQRFTMFMWLGIALAVARWLDLTPIEAWKRYGAAGLAAVLLLPNVASPDLHRPEPVPELFRRPALAARLAPPGHALLILHPAKGQDMLWQADDGFAFAMAQGHMGNEPPAYRRSRVWTAIRDDRPGRLRASAFVSFLRIHRVSAIVVSPGAVATWTPLLRATGLSGFERDGVRVYPAG